MIGFVLSFSQNVISHFRGCSPIWIHGSDQEGNSSEYWWPVFGNFHFLQRIFLSEFRVLLKCFSHLDTTVSTTLSTDILTAEQTIPCIVISTSSSNLSSVGRKSERIFKLICFAMSFSFHKIAFWFLYKQFVIAFYFNISDALLFLSRKKDISLLEWKLQQCHLLRRYAWLGS